MGEESQSDPPLTHDNWFKEVRRSSGSCFLSAEDSG